METEVENGYCLKSNDNKSIIWLISPEGDSVARFNVNAGMHIHRTMEEQIAGKPMILIQKSGKMNHIDLKDFADSCKQYYDVTIDKTRIEFAN